MKKYKYVFWDMDGTIVDTHEGVSKSLAPAFAHYGVEWNSADYHCFIGPPMRYSLPKYANVPENIVEDVIAMFRERYNTIGVFECSPFPGIRETLAAMHGAGYIQIVASSKPEVRCEEILRKFEMADLFDGVVGASLDGKIDSKIEVLTEAFRRVRAENPGFSLEEAVLIGDTRYDADGARQAGIDCVGVSYGYGGEKELKEHGADVILGSPDALAEAFLKAGEA